MRLPVWYWVIAVLILLINAIVYAFLPGGERVLNWTSSLLPIASAIVGTIGIFLAVSAFKAWDRTKLAWLLLACGMILSAAGETAYMILDSALGVDVESMGSTAADVFWMLAYAPYLASLLLFVLGYRSSGLPMGRVQRYLILLTAGCAAAVGLVLLVLVPILRDAETAVLDKVVYLYYPIGDFVLLVPATILILITAQFGKSLLSFPWKCLAIAFLLWAGADLVYSWLSWHELYGDGNPIDAAWNLAYLLIGAAGLRQRAVLASA